MKEKLTPEQSAAIAAKGKVIVSASAGSGKTFVMIQKIADLIESGGAMEDILAVTFTKKAAAQMKEKLRTALIARLSTADGAKRDNIKAQLGKIQSADISTIHSFCAHLVRTYFYALDVDSSFDIVSDDDAIAYPLKLRAAENLFDRLYAEGNGHFKLLLEYLRRRRSDDNIRVLLFDAYKNVRMLADYRDKLSNFAEIFSEEGFEEVCARHKQYADERCEMLLMKIKEFAYAFDSNRNADKYSAIIEEMIEAVAGVMQDGLFVPKAKLHTTPKPRWTEDDAAANEGFTVFRDYIKDKYDRLRPELFDRETEKYIFISSGKLVEAFCDVLLQFDAEYTAVKRDEGKLEYDDLEHLTLQLLKDEEIKSRINAKYKHVFVDEYQDVSPVQEQILSAVGAQNVFTVGDVKQAIYGFRGSKSFFFAQKYNRMESGEGSALKLTGNFRSSGGVIDFVNSLFSRTMVSSVCGFDYATSSVMTCGGAYPAGYGSAEIHVFGKDETTKEEASGIYSVEGSAAVKAGHSREGLAVLEIVRRELSTQHFDLKQGKMVDTQPGDICILTRKRGSRSATGIIKALRDAGYTISGADDGIILDRPEVKQMLDILSYIDNSQQDIPLVTALLSPLGGLDEEELAKIKIAYKRDKEKATFRECAVAYTKEKDDPLAYKLADFFNLIYSYRKLSDILGAAKLIDRILGDSGLSAKYAAGGGEKLQSLHRLAEEAYTPAGELSLNAFLNKIKLGGSKLTSPAPSSSDSIKVMTMHASKGLEFPVVIIADAAATFKGNDSAEILFDDELGFAVKYYDDDTRLQHKTVLTRLFKMRTNREDIKNELNLFYVACTRAMCSLHIMTEQIKPYDADSAFEADCYADLFDFSLYTPEYMPPIEDFDLSTGVKSVLPEPDKEVYERVSAHFNKQYAHASSVDLPVKSSASKLLKMNGEPSYYAENEMFKEEGETGTERGVAYHRFLELCDFSIKDIKGIENEISDFVSSGKMTAPQAQLLTAENLQRILSMPAFERLDGATLYREQNFLCMLPADSFLDTDADDGVLFQGAIDLLVRGQGGTRIIDYKYSKKTDGELKEFYAAQLKLYKKAVARILKINEDTISTTIINIYRLSEIPL